jgi:glycosyltransferase involved in cell wall biosynthesis
VNAVFSSEELVIGFAGRIHPHKGLHVLLEAVGEARQRSANVRLIVRGSFATETPKYRAEIDGIVRRLELTDYVSFEGFVSDADKVYDGLHVVCVPSTSPDPLPRSVMEAMARGLVVVAATSGGIPEMITDQESGFLANTASEMAERFLTLAKDATLRNTIGEQARIKCQATFTLDNLHRNITNVYHGTVKKASARLG